MQKNYGYNRRPLWQWILIYAAIGGVIYGLVYYVIGFTSLKNYTTSSETYQNNANMVYVTINNNAFSPANVIIKKGTTVVWTNNDAMAHTVTADKDGPASPELKQSASYTDTFITAGTFEYHCSLHPQIRGVITVTQ